MRPEAAPGNSSWVPTAQNLERERRQRQADVAPEIEVKDEEECKRCEEHYNSYYDDVADRVRNDPDLQFREIESRRRKPCESYMNGTCKHSMTGTDICSHSHAIDPWEANDPREHNPNKLDSHRCDAKQSRAPGEANNGDLYQHIGGVGFFAGDDDYDPNTHDVVHNPFHLENRE